MNNYSNNQSTPLGAHIPLIYHFAMLQDQARMLGFREAIRKAVKPGSRVLELGGGTGVLSFFAAQIAAKVYCVEQIPQNAAAARQFLDSNPNGQRVEVICSDAFQYLPPEPVDVVICEMIHVGMLREKQIQMIESFKQRYRSRFGANQPMPRFVPEAFIQAIQPINYNFDFFGYHAPVPLFQIPGSETPNCSELGQPQIYQTAQYKDNLALRIEWQGELIIEKNGSLNALRLILKNLLALVVEENRAVEWLCQYLIVPLRNPIEVTAGERMHLEIAYNTGCEIEDFQSSIKLIRKEVQFDLSSQIQKTDHRSITSPLLNPISEITTPKSA